MRLSIETKLDRVIVIGSFCDWDMNKAIEVNRKGKSKRLVVDNMPACEYKVLNCKSWLGEEKPIKENRVFMGDKNEIIKVEF